ncbi:MAG: hypothetical protein JWQ45_1876 [Blastococcus sp.]|nr:hypothetical protein [Blastococcus sp.]
MTTSDLRDTTGTDALPRPRAAADDAAASDGAAPEAVAVAPHFPWPEPWHFSRAARPRTEFWDVRTASWRSRGPVA